MSEAARHSKSSHTGIPRPVRRRGEKQERSIQRRGRIADAAIEILALHGVSGLTHRLVARKANVSLAATTYYFDTKFDIVAEASKRTLQGYIDAFHRAAERFKQEPKDRARFSAFAAKLVHNAVGRDRIRALCWAEITLDAHLHRESLELTRQWFSGLADVWFEMAEASGFQQPRETARSAIDLVIGLLLVATSLGLTAEQVDAVLLGGVDPLTAWKVDRKDAALPVLPQRQSKKSLETRSRIINAAIDVLVADGPEALTYRTVATRAGITSAGPFYHFPTIDALLAAAQLRLFEDSKQRYREVAAEIGDILDAERLIDRTATVLVREATEFSGNNLASYAIWLQASRKPELRQMIWSAVSDQYRAWDRLLTPLSTGKRPIDPLLAFCIFVGMHVRILSTGSTLEDLAQVRREFARDFAALTRSTYWL
jgi:AcrR family transcriptional regulator